MILKVVKPKIIDIVDYNYDNLTCVIVMSSSMYFKNTNKMGLLNTKLFMNSGSLFLVNKKYNNETIKRLINCYVVGIFVAIYFQTKPFPTNLFSIEIFSTGICSTKKFGVVFSKVFVCHK